jgi:hypothetical protein
MLGAIECGLQKPELSMAERITLEDPHFAFSSGFLGQSAFRHSSSWGEAWM